MNFFAGVLLEDEGRAVFREGQAEGRDGFMLTLPRKFEHLCRAAAPRAVVLGIRPEHFSLRSSGDAATIAMRVNVVEPLGNDMDVYLNTKLTGQVIARVDAQSGVEADSAVRLSVDVDRIHLFEPGDNGVNLAFESAPAVRAASRPDLVLK
jgi:multiple sugar transport system ATP-binding protein